MIILLPRYFRNVGIWAAVGFFCGIGVCASSWQSGELVWAHGLIFWQLCCTESGDFRSQLIIIRKEIEWNFNNYWYQLETNKDFWNKGTKDLEVFSQHNYIIRMICSLVWRKWMFWNACIFTKVFKGVWYWHWLLSGSLFDTRTIPTVGWNPSPACDE